jgi:hypothetical protein
MFDGGDADIAADQGGREPGITHILATGTDFHRLRADPRAKHVPVSTAAGRKVM